MQGQSYQRNVRVPYSKWSQHRATNGLIYLSHPITGEVKWLWSRHHDPKTSNDYLVNTITGERQWVTKQNAHLCPVKPQTADPALSRSSKPTAGSVSANPFANTAKAPAKTLVSAKQQTKPANTSYREIEAPKSLGLTADEVLMLVPESGRRYIYNKKTKSSRWLPHRQPDTIPGESSTKGFFARNKNTKPTTSPLNDDDTISPELRQKETIPGMNAAPPTAMSRNRPTSGNSTSMEPTLPSRRPDTNSTRKLASRPLNSGTTPPLQAAGKPLGAAQLPVPGGLPNGSPSAAPVYSADEAALVIQRSLRADSVRRANVMGKLHILTSILQDVQEITASGKYDLKHLRAVAERSASQEEKRDGSQRLLELEEYLTQQNLKVDAVESAGSQLVRGKRKESVKMILGLTDEVDGLRKKLQGK